MDHPLPSISGPADAALAAAGIVTLEQAAAVARTEPFALHGFGPSGLRTLEAAIVAAGLRPQAPSGRSGANE